MKRFFKFFFLYSSLIVTAGALENSEPPTWITECRSRMAKTFQTEVKLSRVHELDHLDEGKCFVFCLKGEGSLKKVPDPFAVMHKSFASANWKYIERYQADGHGSSSFAYRKENAFCNIFVNIDSDCDDEETGHRASKFWFEIYCREK